MVKVSTLEEAVRVVKEGERAVITIDGKEIAIISVEELRMIEEREDRLDIEAAEKALAEPGPDIPAEEFWKEFERSRRAPDGGGTASATRVKRAKRDKVAR